ncbi:MAG: prepilin-type N-terminal cleavage/methylation domain-containing protein [Porticoccaceae bacterium]|nr:prepilin-type N-terminal cleavage/methylation domain-containing protein [Porticoccaceae bacterium]
MEKIFKKGFSLVELMVVMGIISLLALVALPSYRNFILRAEFIETKMAVGAVKVSFEVCAQMLGLANVRNCRHNSHGIPDIKNSGTGVVGVKLDSDIFTTESSEEVKEGDKVKIIATAPSDSKNANQTYTLTATLKTGGRVEWNKGECSKAELC